MNKSFSSVSYPNNAQAYQTMLQQTWLLLIPILFAEILQSYAFGSDAEGQMELTARSKKYRFFCEISSKAAARAEHVLHVEDVGHLLGA